MNNSQLFVISAPSGTGKSTLIAKLRSSIPTLGYSISLTTRLPRPEEQDGVDYYFISRQEFKTRIDTGDMVEYVYIFGNFYGTSLNNLAKLLNINKKILLEIDTAGAEQIKKRFPDAILIFLLPPSWIELERRLRNRNTEKENDIFIRLKEAVREIKKVSLFNFIVINKQIEQSIDDLKTIIYADRLCLEYIKNKNICMGKQF